MIIAYSINLVTSKRLLRSVSKAYFRSETYYQRPIFAVKRIQSTVFFRYESNICVSSLIKAIVLNIRIKVSRHNIHMEHIQLTSWICFSRGDSDWTLIHWVMVLNNKPVGLNINNQELLMALLSDHTNVRRSQTSQFLTDKEWGYIMSDNIPALSAFDGPINSRSIQILSFIIQIQQQTSHRTHKGVTNVVIVSINCTTRKHSTQWIESVV